MWRHLISKELLLPFESWEKVRTFAGANSSLCLAAITVITQRVQFTTTGKRNSLNVDNLAPFLAQELATRNICPRRPTLFSIFPQFCPFFPPGQFLAPGFSSSCDATVSTNRSWGRPERWKAVGGECSCLANANVQTWENSNCPDMHQFAKECKNCKRASTVTFTHHGGPQPFYYLLYSKQYKAWICAVEICS